MEAVGIERVDAGNLHVEHVGLAVGLDRRDLGDETLAVGRAAISGAMAARRAPLLGVGEADPRREHGDIVAGDDQFVIGLGVIEPLPPLPSGSSRAPAGRRSR